MYTHVRSSSNCWRTKLQQCINLARLVVALVVQVQPDAGVKELHQDIFVELKRAARHIFGKRPTDNQEQSSVPIDGDRHVEDDNAPDVSAIGLHADASDPQQSHEKTEAGDRKEASTKVRTNDWRKRDHRTHMYFIRYTDLFLALVVLKIHEISMKARLHRQMANDDYGGGGGGRERARVVKFAILLCGGDGGGFHCLSLPFCLMAHV
uniref:Uncharacterized protein n=1 Tax=Trichogramma kaykai TaxID=54128 RepID=A0ABD2VUN2_9HYME